MSCDVLGYVLLRKFEAVVACIEIGDIEEATDGPIAISIVRREGYEVVVGGLGEGNVWLLAINIRLGFAFRGYLHAIVVRLS